MAIEMKSTSKDRSMVQSISGRPLIMLRKHQLASFNACLQDGLAEIRPHGFIPSVYWVDRRAPEA